MLDLGTAMPPWPPFTLPTTHPPRPEPPEDAGKARLRLDTDQELIALDPRAWQLIQANRDVLCVVANRLRARTEPLRWRLFLHEAARGRCQALALQRPGRWPLTA